MAKRRPSGKRTKEEVARSIIDEGTFENLRQWGTHEFRYYRAFGQRWRLTYSLSGFLVSIEQIDDDGKDKHL